MNKIKNSSDVVAYIRQYTVNQHRSLNIMNRRLDGITPGVEDVSIYYSVRYAARSLIFDRVSMLNLKLKREKQRREINSIHDNVYLMAGKKQTWFMRHFDYPFGLFKIGGVIKKKIERYGYGGVIR